ncbi:MFS transporter [Lutibaculum baratangense]|uniref:Major facilitator superfamily (MFS) profile domain-containing protein n=1 Tax=Lutibaculum baratangense AMV1 TaxID=631454 RepID=V4RDY3_9HYPH|nr:MFS transporter [Lutibaculum baratangense]ESR23594.1 hypothetical protein N177_3662 [Lutibaculum baratangense AMV1]
MKGEFGVAVERRSAADESAMRRRGIIAAIICISVVGFGLSLSGPLLSLLLESRGISSTMIGVNTAVAGFASLVTAPLVPRLVRRLGTKRLIYVALANGAVTFSLFPVSDFWLWFPLRFLFTSSVTILFIVSEFWIATAAPEGRRGFVMGIYATVLSFGFAVGPGALAVFGSENPILFVLVPATFLAAALPVAFGRAVAPAVDRAQSFRFLALLFVAPSATLAALVFGAFEQTTFSLTALYGLRNGLGEGAAAMLISVVGIGNMLFQIPIGLAADRLNRTLALAVCALAGLIGALLLPFVVGSLWLVLPLVFIWGGLTGGLYTIGLTHLAARFSGADLAAANSLFVMLYSFGMLVGPISAGAAMDVWDPHGFAWVMASLFGLYMLVPFTRFVSSFVRRG